MKRLCLLALAAAAALAGCGPKAEEAKQGAPLPNQDRLMQDQIRRKAGQGTAAPGQAAPRFQKAGAAARRVTQGYSAPAALPIESTRAIAGTKPAGGADASLRRSGRS